MRGIIRANVNLPGFARGEEREVEITEEVARRAANGLISVVSTEGGELDFDTSEAEQAAGREAKRLLDKANVVGVAGGEDEVVVFVEEKKPLSDLRKKDVVDEEVDGLPTDVIEVGKIEPLLRPGDSIGLKGAGSTGTLGGVVEDEHGNVYGLTNNHVAADSNRGKVLTDVEHPGPADGTGRRIGVLGRFEPIFFDRSNLLDAALIPLDPDTPVEQLHDPQTATARVGWTVRKTGRTSGLTAGRVLARNATVDVSFGRQGVARFAGQIVTDHMLDAGDSGSVLVSEGGHPVGLGFAGSDSISIHTPINLVLRTLAVRFRG